MGRDKVVPFNAAPDSGRLGFRYPDEPSDERPVISWQPFWADASEQLAYEDAVSAHPKKPTEGPMAYVARLSAIVTGQFKKAGMSMPRRMSQREWEKRQNELKRQWWKERD